MPVFNLLLTAQDRGPVPRASTANIQIVLSDVNDNPPIFEQLVYMTEITEVGKVVHVHPTTVELGCFGSCHASYIVKFEHLSVNLVW